MDLGRPWVFRALAIALAAAVGVLVWLVARDEGGEGGLAPVPGAPRIVSEEELAELPALVGHPVYWAGPIEGTRLELSEEGAGVLLRYLEPDDGAGEAIAERLAVGSYPLPDPRRALDGFASSPGAIVRRNERLGTVVSNRGARSSVYFADPGNAVQVEVFAPSPRRAMRLVLSGRVRPLG